LRMFLHSLYFFFSRTPKMDSRWIRGENQLSEGGFVLLRRLPSLMCNVDVGEPVWSLIRSPLFCRRMGRNDDFSWLPYSSRNIPICMNLRFYEIFLLTGDTICTWSITSNTYNEVRYIYYIYYMQNRSLYFLGDGFKFLATRFLVPRLQCGRLMFISLEPQLSVFVHRPNGQDREWSRLSSLLFISATGHSVSRKRWLIADLVVEANKHHPTMSCGRRHLIFDKLRRQNTWYPWTSWEKYGLRSTYQQVRSSACRKICMSLGLAPPNSRGPLNPGRLRGFTRSQQFLPFIYRFWASSE
jgi:hypothetical protein